VAKFSVNTYGLKWVPGVARACGEVPRRARLGGAGGGAGPILRDARRVIPCDFGTP
jgi:hypothetical protein